ncbi:hypothetical protein AB0D33_25670 [Streptomyces sp. NPDC048404]|uniref:hypothetical protein n=1 Tax=unclassified Streptomyces TaxID=2593676 RepID=UPI0034409E9D
MAGVRTASESFGLAPPQAHLVALLPSRERGGGVGHVSSLVPVPASCLGVRDTDTARRAVAGLSVAFDIRPFDVSDLTSVRAFAESWSGDLGILINNAGVMDIPAARTADDLLTATNDTGPFLLTTLLLHRIGRVGEH